jgi:hypothetical protein
VKFVLLAREPAPVRVAARSPYAMTVDAELLARAPVTTRARHGVDSRLHPVLPAAGARDDPASRVRAPSIRAGRHALSDVAVHARVVTVARYAKPRIGARFLGVPRSESGTVQTRQAYLVEGKLGRKGRDRAATVASGARARAVAARTEIAVAGGAHAMFAHEVRVMHEVVGGGRSLGGKVDVTAIAVAQRPLVAVLMAAETGRHLGQSGLRVALRDLDVTSNAVSVGHPHVLAVLEAQVLARQLHAFADIRFAVALATNSLVVRFGVTAAAVGLGRNIGTARGVGARDPRVAFDAIDPFQRVRSVLEWV